MRRHIVLLKAAPLLLLVTLGSTTARAAASQQSEQTIRAMIEHRLSEHHLNKEGTIQVAVTDHQVNLTGTVETLAQKRKVEEQARAVDDAVQVNNQLTVQAQDVTDPQIADGVAKAIRSYVFYNIYDWIEGNVQDGVLTLRGYTIAPWRVQDYGRLAEGVPGVKEIRNQIQALPASIFDDQMRVALARAIYHYPGFEHYAMQPYPPIHIIVNNGHVTLEGVVSSAMDRTIAEQVARSRVLAFDVVNHLRVGDQK